MELDLLEKIQEPVELKEDLLIVSGTMPTLELVIDEDYQEDFPTLINKEDQTEKDTFAYQLGLMVDLLQVEEAGKIEELVDKRYKEITGLMKENQKVILQKIRPYEGMLRAVNLFFKNAGTGDIENAFFISVDPAKFAGNNNTAHFDEMCKYLKKEYYAWEIDQSPAFIGYIGDIGDGAAEMATIAEETVAMAVVDIMKTSKPDATLNRSKARELSGIDPKWGHLIVSGAWVTARDAYSDLEQQPLFVPSASAVIGKLMGTDTGKHITGFTTASLQGFRKTAYKIISDTTESFKFRKAGLVLLVDKKKGGVQIIGDRTANTSDNDDLRKISKMVVRNKVMKDLVAFCNLKTDSQTDGLKEQIVKYLNECKRIKVIKGYQKLEIKEVNEDEVDISVELIYFETKSKYNIAIAGAKGALDVSATKEGETEEAEGA